MADSIESVKEAARLFRKWSTDPSSNAATRAHWAASASNLDTACAELARLRSWAKPVPAIYGDLSDLPAEVVAQLSGVKTDELENQIYTTVKAAGVQVDLDHLLIELYRRFKIVHSRRFVMNKCWRMAQKGLIHIVPGRKGVYSALTQVDERGHDGATGYEGDALPAKPGPTADDIFSTDLDEEIPF